MKILKRVAIGLASLLALLILLVVGLNVRGRSKAASAPTITTRSVAALSDSFAVARGRHLAEAIMACEHCHDAGLRGKTFPTPAVLISMAAPNLTRGQGGVGEQYTVIDWDRAIRHGIAKDGRQLAIMPSEAYAHLSDADFAALVAYLETLPAFDHAFPARTVGVMGATLIGAGVFPLAPEMIDHDSVGMRSVAAGVTAEYGGYLANIGGCRTCHGPDLQGRDAPGGNSPPAPSLVAFASARSFDDFRQTLRTGRTPSDGGRMLDAQYMPWSVFARMNDDELQAIWLYIESKKTAAKAP